MASPIRLLAVTHSATLGGNQLHMAKLLRRFSSADVMVTTILLPGSGPFSQLLAQKGLSARILSLPELSRLSSPGVLVREIAKWPDFAQQFEALLQELKPDIVYANSHRAAIVVEPILTRRHIPLVWRMSEFIKFQTWHRWVVQRITRRASAIVVISNITREAILHLGAIPERVHAIPIGINSEAFDLSVARVVQFREAQSIAREGLLIGMVGWIQPLKGWHVLVEAIPFVRAAFPRARFLFVGDCNEDRFRNYQIQLRARLTELGQTDAVIWLGYRQDIPLIMNACDIVIQASIEPETLGVTVLEAMAARKPVICSNLGALPEVNLNGETGLVVAPNQPLELAEAIKCLLWDVGLRTRMGMQGRRRVERDYTEQQETQAHIDLFQHLVAKNSKRTV